MITFTVLDPLNNAVSAVTVKVVGVAGSGFAGGGVGEGEETLSLLQPSKTIANIIKQRLMLLHFFILFFKVNSKKPIVKYKKYLENNYFFFAICLLLIGVLSFQPHKYLQA